MDVKESTTIGLVDAKKILMEKANEKELGYEQKNALEHLQKFCKLSKKRETELIEVLKAVGKLKDHHLITIANMLPQDPDDLRVLFGTQLALTADEKKNIVDTVKKHI